ncbi:ABC transporter permease [Proteiniclasticum ruminis]|uniref:Putative ABC transport system permease protein n=1 Tax=Proteiniclasticum ruminis TaxID=398199 RepID=A0A1I5BC95_9CLOT|nr:ABC transporter permease [Proteiniclasticum ruminis]SFN72316.1 putative ABC transport system permease protein [Proteiniclasticum ruminis]
MSILISILEQGLLFAILVFGIYITYKIMDFADLSVDGTYPLGAATAAVLLLRGMNPWAATILGAMTASLGGLVTGIIHTKLKINGLMAGILVMFGLYSVNLRVMGKANIPLFAETTVFTLPEVSIGGENLSTLLLLLLIVTVLLFVYEAFFRTKTGFFLRAVGDNEEILTSLGADAHKIKILGLMTANFLAGLSGALTAQYQGFSDVGMGTGSAVTALAAVIIGSSLLKKLSLPMTSIALSGAVLYKGILVLVLRLGLDPNDFKLATAIAVILAMGMSSGALKKRRKQSGLKKETKEDKGGAFYAKAAKLVKNL